MLRTALEFVQDEINAFVKIKDPVNFGNKEIAIISRIVDQEGKFDFQTTGNDNHKIIISLANLEECRAAECQNFIHKAADGTIQKVNPAVNLVFFILFTAYSDDYKSSLRNLTYVVSYFQNNLVFTEKSHPHLNAAADENKPWQKVKRLTFSHYNMTFEQQNNMWAAVGAKYLPSVMYKMRILRFQELETQEDTPPIIEANLDD